MSRHNKNKDRSVGQKEKADRLEKYKEMLYELRQKEERLRAEGDNISADYLLKNQIKPLWRRIEVESIGRTMPLTQLAKMAGYNCDNLVNTIIKVHLMCDYLTELTDRIKDELRNMGAEQCNVFKITQDAYKQCQFMAGLLAGRRSGILTDALVDDEEYIEALDKLTDGCVEDIDKVTADYMVARKVCPQQWRKCQEQQIGETENTDSAK